jgi:hypothetical protein
MNHMCLQNYNYLKVINMNIPFFSENKKKENLKLMNDFLNKQNKNVKDNALVALPSDELPFLLHISINGGIKSFIPRIGHRQDSSEDRTIPRICVADTLIGAMIGYSSVFHDFKNGYGVYKNGVYKGGYYIYALEYGACVVPNNKLVFDANQTGERWLINYRDGTDVYKGNIIGKFFIRNVELNMRNNSKELVYHSKCTIYLEIKKPIYITLTEKVKAGYYKLTGPLPENVTSYKKKAYEITEITAQEYKQIKNISVSLLDNNQNYLLDWI